MRFTVGQNLLSATQGSGKAAVLARVRTIPFGVGKVGLGVRRAFLSGLSLVLAAPASTLRISSRMADQCGDETIQAPEFRFPHRLA